MKAILVLSLSLAACNTTPPAGPAPRKPAPAPAAPSSAIAVPTTRASAKPPALPPEGCWSGAEPPAAARAKLDALAGACVQGMHAVGPEPLVVELAAGSRKDLPFTVTDPSRCVRAGAAGGEGVQALTLAIVDAIDHVQTSADLHGAFAFAGAGGPVCLDRAGAYRAVVRVTRGAGPVAIQVWQAPAH